MAQALGQRLALGAPVQRAAGTSTRHRHDAIMARLSSSPSPTDRLVHLPGYTRRSRTAPSLRGARAATDTAMVERQDTGSWRSAPCDSQWRTTVQYGVRPWPVTAPPSNFGIEP